MFLKLKSSAAYPEVWKRALLGSRKFGLTRAFGSRRLGTSEDERDNSVVDKDYGSSANKMNTWDTNRRAESSRQEIDRNRDTSNRWDRNSGNRVDWNQVESERSARERRDGRQRDEQKDTYNTEQQDYKSYDRTNRNDSTFSEADGRGRHNRVRGDNWGGKASEVNSRVFRDGGWSGDVEGKASGSGMTTYGTGASNSTFGDSSYAWFQKEGSTQDGQDWNTTQRLSSQGMSGTSGPRGNDWNRDTQNVATRMRGDSRRWDGSSTSDQQTGRGASSRYGRDQDSSTRMYGGGGEFNSGSDSGRWEEEGGAQRTGPATDSHRADGKGTDRGWGNRDWRSDNQNNAGLYHGGSTSQRSGSRRDGDSDYYRRSDQDGSSQQNSRRWDRQGENADARSYGVAQRNPFGEMNGTGQPQKYRSWTETEQGAASAYRSDNRFSQDENDDSYGDRNSQTRDRERKDNQRGSSSQGWERDFSQRAEEITDQFLASGNRGQNEARRRNETTSQSTAGQRDGQSTGQGWSSGQQNQTTSQYQSSGQGTDKWGDQSSSTKKWDSNDSTKKNDSTNDATRKWDTNSDSTKKWENNNDSKNWSTAGSKDTKFEDDKKRDGTQRDGVMNDDHSKKKETDKGETKWDHDSTNDRNQTNKDKDGKTKWDSSAATTSSATTGSKWDTTAATSSTGKSDSKTGTDASKTSTTSTNGSTTTQSNTTNDDKARTTKK